MSRLRAAFFINCGKSDQVSMFHSVVHRILANDPALCESVLDMYDKEIGDASFIGVCADLWPELTKAYEDKRLASMFMPTGLVIDVDGVAVKLTCAHPGRDSTFGKQIGDGSIQGERVTVNLRNYISEYFKMNPVFEPIHASEKDRINDILFDFLGKYRDTIDRKIMYAIGRTAHKMPNAIAKDALGKTANKL